MRRLTFREEKIRQELETAVAMLDTAHVVLSRVVAAKPPRRATRLSLHHWVWASAVRLTLDVLRVQLRAAAESTPERLAPE